MCMYVCMCTQIPLSGYGGRSEVRIVNMGQCAHQESLYYHSVRASSSSQPTIITALLHNCGTQTAFVNALAFKGSHLLSLRIRKGMWPVNDLL